MVYFLHHKKTTPKQRGLLLIIYIFKYLVFYHYLLESHCADLHSEVVNSYNFLNFYFTDYFACPVNTFIYDYDKPNVTGNFITVDVAEYVSSRANIRDFVCLPCNAVTHLFFNLKSNHAIKFIMFTLIKEN